MILLMVLLDLLSHLRIDDLPKCLLLCSYEYNFIPLSHSIQGAFISHFIECLEFRKQTLRSKQQINDYKQNQIDITVDPVYS